MNATRFSKNMIYSGGGSSVFVLTFQPGQALPPHKHPGSDVLLLVLEGKGAVRSDDVAAEISEGDLIQCGGDEELSLENTSDTTLSVLVNLLRLQQ